MVYIQCVSRACTVSTHSKVRRAVEYTSGFCLRGLPQKRVEVPHLPETMSSAHTEGSKSIAEQCRLGDKYYISAGRVGTGQVVNPRYVDELIVGHEASKE